jgi:hypothetical protein
MKFRDGSSSLYLDLFIFRPVSNQTCFVSKFRRTTGTDTIRLVNAITLAQGLATFLIPDA